jgi:tRNA pseudouridine13 synthase
MKIKQRPEDFSVKESYRFDEVADGPFRIYLMDKQKLSTFDAIGILAQKFGLKPGQVSYCGLKDKQGRTEQIIAVKGVDIEMQEENLRLKLLGRTDKPLSSANTTSNRFAVTVRAVPLPELPQLTLAAAELGRLGVINYFDSQRFGSLKHGQGFIAKDLLRGDFEAGLRNYLARPSPLDRSEDAKVKEFWAQNWGDWNARCPFPSVKKYWRVLKALQNEPTDFVNAFLQIDSDYRAMLLFTYQSYLWNESVRRLLQLTFTREQLFPMPYQAGTLLFHQDATHDQLEYLTTIKVPLLGPTTTFEDTKVAEAVTWVLGREKLKLEELRIKEAPRMLYFKHELRHAMVHPAKLVVGKPRPDEHNRGFMKVNVAFTLPPGSYATLVVKRLFHFSEQEHFQPKHVEPVPVEEEREEVPQKPGRWKNEKPATGRAEQRPGAIVRVGYLERQRLMKDERKQRRPAPKAKPAPKGKR